MDYRQSQQYGETGYLQYKAPHVSVPNMYPNQPNQYSAYSEERQQPREAPAAANQPSYVHHPGPQGNTSFVHQLGPPIELPPDQKYKTLPGQPPMGSMVSNPGLYPNQYTASAYPALTQMPPGSYVTMEKVPAVINCPRCYAPIITKLKSKATAKTVVAAAAIGFIFWPLAFVPFVSNRMKKTVHVCPNCHHTLGKVVTVASVPSYS